MKAKELRIIIVGNNAEAIISTIHDNIQELVPAIKDCVKQFTYNNCEYFEK